MKNELPIFFTSEMECKADKEIKTHTRRIIKPQPFLKAWEWSWNKKMSNHTKKSMSRDLVKYFCKYQIDMILWLRQNFKITDFDKDHTVTGVREDGSKFSNIKLTDKEWSKFIKWKNKFSNKSKLFMFRSLSYKSYKITNVRAERLKDITTDDIIAEGISPSMTNNTEGLGEESLDRDWISHQWMCLWDSINEKRGFSYESNPWVWAIEFEKTKDHA